MPLTATPSIAWRRTFRAVAAAVALLALSACGAAEGDGVASAGGEENPARPAETEDAAPIDEDAQALVFAECMRGSGVAMPDPGPGQQGLIDALRSVSRDYGRATMRRALAACQDLMPQYAQEHPTGDDWQLDLAECLREQGLDVSDTPFEDAHSGAVDVNEFSAAMEVCRDVLTGGGR
jgi:hypothetical protein